MAGLAGFIAGIASLASIWIGFGSGFGFGISIFGASICNFGGSVGGGSFGGGGTFTFGCGGGVVGTISSVIS
jgi:hypothetical protein